MDMLSRQRGKKVAPPDATSFDYGPVRTFLSDKAILAMRALDRTPKSCYGGIATIERGESYAQFYLLPIPCAISCPPVFDQSQISEISVH